jgi:hypothetical protein
VVPAGGVKILEARRSASREISRGLVSATRSKLASRNERMPLSERC